MSAAFFIAGISFSGNAHESDHIHPAEGFSKPAPPNTVAGLKKSAKIGDYALLRGQFVRRFEDDVFEFSENRKQPDTRKWASVERTGNEGYLFCNGGYIF